ncbi:MAG TPA: hypothetical protein ENI29_04865 [bacterium]|nr:hypothetical protein [bacterium]
MSGYSNTILYLVEEGYLSDIETFIGSFTPTQLIEPIFIVIHSNESKLDYEIEKLLSNYLDKFSNEELLESIISVIDDFLHSYNF